MNSDNCHHFDILCVLLGPVYSQFNNHRSILFMVILDTFSSASSPLLTSWIGYAFLVPVIQSLLLSSTLAYVLTAPYKPIYRLPHPMSLCCSQFLLPVNLHAHCAFTKHMESNLRHTMLSSFTP